MRFEDMVLNKASALKASPPGARFLGPYWYQMVEAQHEADMAYEVTCPCGCHGAAAHGRYVELMVDVEERGCGLCGGTGRVTLGQIVAWNRGRKV